MFNSQLFAKVEKTENCYKALDLISNYEFDFANKIIDNEKEINPNNHYTYYLKNYIFFLETFFTEDNNIYNKYKKQLYETITILENEKESIEINSLISEVYLKYAIVNFKMGDNWNATFNLLKSYKNLLININLGSNLKNDKKLIAIFNLIFGSIPDEYIWISDFFGFKGNTQLGLNYFKTYYNSNNNDKFEKNESAILYILSNNIFSSKTENELKINFYDTKNNLVLFVYAFNLIRSGKSASAISIYKNIDNNVKNKIPIIYYYEGIARLNLLNEDANNYFDKFISLYSGKNFIKSAYHKLYWYYSIFKNDLKKEFYRTNTINNGFSLFDADKQALVEALSNNENTSLLKIRLLTDGGDYMKSLDILTKDSVEIMQVNKNLINEYYYRKARIFQKLNDFYKAEYYYKKVINDSHYYYANSQLLLANIYENKKDYYKALIHYKKVIKSNTQEYRISLQHKAKSGINRINYQIKK